jgi:hypothetical protein
MAGIIPLACQQVLDLTGAPLVGALLETFVVSTTNTIQNTYQDAGLSILNPWPLPTDAYGRIPFFYLADGFVHARLLDPTGVVLLDVLSMQVTGPSSGGGGGGGGSVDPTTVLSTGDIKFRATSETLTGWVKVNGQTIGSATSGASERANADTQNLFVYLWNNFTNAHCPVAGGRGSSGLLDFQANKAVGLPDLRARVPTGLDDMGNAAAGIILTSNVTSGGGDGPTTPGAFGGEANHTLVVAEAPPGQITLNDPGHSHTAHNQLTASDYAFGPTVSFTGDAATTTNTTGITLTDHAGGGAHQTMSPFLLGSFFMKL